MLQAAQWHQMNAVTPFILQALTQRCDNGLIACISCLTFAFITPVFLCNSFVFVVKNRERCLGLRKWL